MQSIQTTSHHTRRTYLLNYSNKLMVCFFDDACYQYFLVRLFNSLKQFHVELHAYCLAAKEIYLLMTPGTPHGINNLWKATALQYNSYFAIRFSRSIRIIKPLYESIEAGAEETALQMQRRIERVPIDKLQADHPGTHPWSSYCVNSFGYRDTWLTPHPEYLRFLHENDREHDSGRRYDKYREYIAASQHALSIPALSDKSDKAHTLGR